MFAIDPRWAAYLEANGDCRQRYRKTAEAVWFNLPFVLAFAAMLNSEGLLEERRSDLARLNRARIGRGRAPLLDHIETRMILARGSVERGLAGGGRAVPRLHVVRGHLVRRGDKAFWRHSHLRGDAAPPLTRTVAIRTSRA